MLNTFCTELPLLCTVLTEKICELRIIDSDRYNKVVEHQRAAKASAKSIEDGCRVALNEYRVQANKLKQEKKLLPFYPKEDFYTQK